MKLNIGCGYPIDNFEDGEDEIIGIDDGSDWYSDYSKYKPKVVSNFIYGDGNILPFKNNTFDEVFSNQCAGLYVMDYEEMVRVLKKGGTIELGVWSDKVSIVLAKLILLDIDIFKVDWSNGCIEDDYTLSIYGRKIGE